jgi:hypothetical protein
MLTTEESLRINAHSHFNRPSLEDRICNEALEDFKQVTRQYALFHILFFSIAVLELAAFVFFFSFLTKTMIFSFSLAGLFLTGFTYFVLLLYFQAKKPNQLLEVQIHFLEALDSALPFEKRTAEHYLALATALSHLLSKLHRLEYSYYSVPASFKTLSPLMQKFSAWTHWKDLHQMKELLLLKKIKQQIELIKLNPTDLETHACLANSYLILSQLYLDPRKLYPDEEHFWVSPDYASLEMLQKFKQTSFRASEEYKILDFYAPNTPWVHAQLALIYHHLDLFHEEIREYETILNILPNDYETLFRLGVLYFKQGLSAQGLRIYEQLKKSSEEKASELIANYDFEL